MSRHEVFNGPAEPVALDTMPGVTEIPPDVTEIARAIERHKAAVAALEATCSRETLLPGNEFQALQAQAHSRIDEAFQELVAVDPEDIEDLSRLTGYASTLLGGSKTLEMDVNERDAILAAIDRGLQGLLPPKASDLLTSAALLDAYDEWLDLERSWLKWQRFGRDGMDMPDRATFEAVYRDRRTGRLFDYRRCNRVAAKHGGRGDSPSRRAAAVLAAAGARVRTCVELDT